MSYQYIDAEEHGKVLVLRLDDPSTRNAMRPETSDELLTEIARFEKSTQLQCLVLTGTDPSFCSGSYVPSLLSHIEEVQQPKQHSEEVAPLPWAALDARCAKRATDPREEEQGERSLFNVLMRLQKPSIAAINGFCMGAGHGVALSCDIRIASERAKLSETFIRRAGFPGDGSCWLLPRMVGLSNAYLQMYTGDMVDAQTALRRGEVSEVVPHDQLMKFTLELATRLADGPVYHMGLIKYVVQQSQNLTYDESFRLARTALDIAYKTADHKEGVQAFLEKRSPRFEGR